MVFFDNLLWCNISQILSRTVEVTLCKICIFIVKEAENVILSHHVCICIFGCKKRVIWFIQILEGEIWNKEGAGIFSFICFILLFGHDLVVYMHTIYYPCVVGLPSCWIYEKYWRYWAKEGEITRSSKLFRASFIGYIFYCLINIIICFMPAYNQGTRVLIIKIYIICLHIKYSRCILDVDIWSTPDVDYILTSGVLQMLIICWHLECSIC